MKRRMALLLPIVAALAAGCGVRPLPRPVPTVHLVDQAAQVLPTWMTACISAEGIAATELPAGTAPQLTSETVLGTARGWDSALTTSPATAAYMVYDAGSLAQGTTLGAALAQPLWAVGFGSLHWQLPTGFDVPATANLSARPYMSGLIVFISDPGNTPVLELDCPS